jgi:flagellar biosynthesis chaperone FliJ
MPFRFALETLRRLRYSIEHQRMLALQEASFQLARKQELMAQFDKFLAESALADANALSVGRTGADLQFASLLRDQLQQFRRQIENEVRQLQDARNRAAATYQKAYRDREALDSLRARARHAYQIEQMRRQQKELDAAYLLQRWQRRNG